MKYLTVVGTRYRSSNQFESAEIYDQGTWKPLLGEQLKEAQSFADYYTYLLEKCFSSKPKTHT